MQLWCVEHVWMVQAKQQKAGVLPILRLVGSEACACACMNTAIRRSKVADDSKY
jgi:hypothetical protein